MLISLVTFWKFFVKSYCLPWHVAGWSQHITTSFTRGRICSRLAIFISFNWTYCLEMVSLKANMDSSKGSPWNMKFWDFGGDLLLKIDFGQYLVIILLVNIPEMLHQTHIHSVMFQTSPFFEYSTNSVLFFFPFSAVFFSAPLILQTAPSSFVSSPDNTKYTQKGERDQWKSWFYSKRDFLSFARLSWLGFLFGLMLDEY